MFSWPFENERVLDRFFFLHKKSDFQKKRNQKFSSSLLFFSSFFSFPVLSSLFSL